MVADGIGFIYSNQSLCKLFLDMKIASFNAGLWAQESPGSRCQSTLIKVKTKTVSWAAAAYLDHR